MNNPSPSADVTGRDARSAGAGKPIIVKFLARGKGSRRTALWTRQFPRQEPVWGRCRFVFDFDASEYDWLVVYDDLPPVNDERFSLRTERLACHAAQTLLITGEPSSVKIYGRPFLAQFGRVLTSQEPWAIRHPGAIYAQAGLRWYYGLGAKTALKFDEMAAAPPPEKKALISTVCSDKQQRHTLHHRRYAFVQQLKSRLHELEVFGHGVRFMDDKAEALDAFRYHIAIENHVARHHWTEKLADSFLGWTLPFYFGCPNAADYFPAESFIPIDINDVERAEATIRSAIANGEYERRLPAIREARRRVLHEYNLFATISRIIESPQTGVFRPGDSGVIHSRRLLRRKKPWQLFGFGLEKVRAAWLARRTRTDAA